MKITVNYNRKKVDISIVSLCHNHILPNNFDYILPIKLLGIRLKGGLDRISSVKP